MSFASEGMYTSRERFIKRGFRGEAPRRGGSGIHDQMPGQARHDDGDEARGRLPPLPFVVN